jgi:hypothetical protein
MSSWTGMTVYTDNQSISYNGDNVRDERVEEFRVRLQNRMEAVKQEVFDEFFTEEEKDSIGFWV